MPARILVIEDNKVSLELVQYLLKSFGYGSFAACNGQEGLRLARQENPDLILCDLQMPLMNGYEVIQELIKDPQLKLIPVIAVTALSMPGDRENVLANGFAGYIPKPIDPETFVQTIEQFLGAELKAHRPEAEA